MPNRNELVIRARAVGIDPANYPNDSKLEQRVIFEETSAGTSAGSTKATQTLTSTGVAPTDGDTVTVGGQKYTFKTALTGAAFEVLIGASAAAALDNLKSAINATAGAGTTYGTGTPANEQVTATTNTDTTQVVEAREAGLGGNRVAVSEAAVTLSWGAAVLAGGVPGTAAADVSASQVSGGALV